MREAVAGSTTLRRMLGSMALIFIVVLLVDGVRALWLPTISSLWERLWLWSDLHRTRGSGSPPRAAGCASMRTNWTATCPRDAYGCE